MLLNTMEKYFYNARESGSLGVIYITCHIQDSRNSSVTVTMNWKMAKQSCKRQRESVPQTIWFVSRLVGKLMPKSATKGPMIKEHAIGNDRAVNICDRIISKVSHVQEIFQVWLISRLQIHKQLHNHGHICKWRTNIIRWCLCSISVKIW